MKRLLIKILIIHRNLVTGISLANRCSERRCQKLTRQVFIRDYIQGVGFPVQSDVVKEIRARHCPYRNGDRCTRGMQPAICNDLTRSLDKCNALEQRVNEALRVMATGELDPIMY